MRTWNKEFEVVLVGHAQGWAAGFPRRMHPGLMNPESFPPIGIYTQPFLA
jgi:hypothetical protein